MLVRATEGAERGYIFWRIGERPILQKPHGLIVKVCQTLRVFDLSRELPGSNQKIQSLRAQRLCGEGDLLVLLVTREAFSRSYIH